MYEGIRGVRGYSRGTNVLEEYERHEEARGGSGGTRGVRGYEKVIPRTPARHSSGLSTELHMGEVIRVCVSFFVGIPAHLNYAVTS